MSQRLFVGGLSPTISKNDLNKKFGKFGAIYNIEIKSKPDAGGTGKNTFCFIDMNAPTGKLNDCKYYY